MIDLRNYKELVRTAIKKAAEKDMNWKWRMKACNKNEIKIRWSYLADYLESENENFVIELEEVKDDDSKEVIYYWLWANKPGMGVIGCWELEADGGRTSCSISIENALEQAVNKIINYAVNTY